MRSHILSLKKGKSHDFDKNSNFKKQVALPIIKTTLKYVHKSVMKTLSLNYLGLDKYLGHPFK